MKSKNIVDSNFSAEKNHFFDYTPDVDDRKAVRVIVIELQLWHWGSRLGGK